MARLFRSCRLFSLALGVIGSAVAWADVPAADPQAAITKQAQAFVEAFQKGDAAAVAEFWTPDGDYVDVSGDAIQGRKAIAQRFTQVFAENKGLKLRIDIQSVRFPTADAAIEDGVTSVMSPDGGLPSRTHYTNFLVKKDGQWLLASVHESAYVPPSHYDQLQPLEWLVGEWVEDTKDSRVGRVTFQWTPDRNFLVGTRAVAVGDLLLDNGSERIGWDPAAKMIRSWNFEPDGGFSQGTWKSDGDKWVITTSLVSASGKTVTATISLAHTDPDTITLQPRVQKPGEKTPTDMPPIKMKRAK